MEKVSIEAYLDLKKKIEEIKEKNKIWNRKYENFRMKEYFWNRLIAKLDNTMTL